MTAVNRAIQPAAVLPIIGRSANNTIREHLVDLNKTRPNQLGGKRTQFYGQAARSTQFQVVGDSAIVSINQVGIAQRYYGGTIRPRSSKYLTIPVAPEAYGHRASEFNLELVFGKGGQPVALATIPEAPVKGSKTSRDPRSRYGVIMFRLVKQVNQPADTSVLPTPAELYLDIERNVDSYLNRIIARTSGGVS